MAFPFPYRGHATFLTKAAVERLIQPIICDDAQDEHDKFSKMACWRLQRDALKEKELYKPGMSVADLMQAYTSGLPFTGVDSWTNNNSGYCMHSDHTIAYFINFYHVAVPESTWPNSKNPTDKIRYQCHRAVVVD